MRSRIRRAEENDTAGRERSRRTQGESNRRSEGGMRGNGDHGRRTRRDSDKQGGSTSSEDRQDQALGPDQGRKFAGLSNRRREDIGSPVQEDRTDPVAGRKSNRGPQGLVSRRAAFTLVSLMVLAGAVLVDAVFIEPERVSLDRVEIALPGLPRDLEGVTLLQVSDMESRGRGRREDLVASLASQAGADIVVVTGDLVAKTLRGESRS